MIESLQQDDIVLADRGFCSYMIIALLLAAGVDSCVRNNASRKKNIPTNLWNAQLKEDHIVTWTKPECPDWMSEEE
jgi:hypothetical protein